MEFDSFPRWLKSSESLSRSRTAKNFTKRVRAATAKPNCYSALRRDSARRIKYGQLDTYIDDSFTA